MSGALRFGTGGFAPGTPLAERMRPRSLDEVVGQDALAGPEGVLRRLADKREVPSLVFWGPPGCGKTTLARLPAAATGAEFMSFSAVLAGVKEARGVMEGARRLRAATGPAPSRPRDRMTGSSGRRSTAGSPESRARHSSPVAQAGRRSTSMPTT